jgi:hypothetical protein
MKLLFTIMYYKVFQMALISSRRHIFEISGAIYLAFVQQYIFIVLIRIQFLKRTVYLNVRYC